MSGSSARRSRLTTSADGRVPKRGLPAPSKAAEPLPKVAELLARVATLLPGAMASGGVGW